MYRKKIHHYDFVRPAAESADASDAMAVPVTLMH